MTKELRELIERLPRYKGFTLLDESKPFNEFFEDQSFDCVQVHCVTPMESHPDDVYGWCGSFSWNDNTLKSLDGDSYNEKVMVLGYMEFTNPEAGVTKGLEILAENDW